MVQQLAAAGIAPSTGRVYKTGQDRFIKFCEEAGLSAFPASEKVLMLFIAYLHTQKISHGTIKSYLVAVRYGHIFRGLGDPRIHEMPQLEYILKGVKKSSPQCTRTRLPITPEILMDLKKVWQRADNRQDAKLLWAAACLCFFGFLRSGEVTMPSEVEYDQQSHLCHEDVKVYSHTAPSYIQVRLKASKTDPFRQGVELHLGATGKELCPVAAVLSFMAVRGNSRGPLFTWRDGRFFTRDKFVKCMRAALDKAGYPADKYAGHSFRIGAATTAGKCGVPDSLIKMMGRWESTAYMCYMRTAPETLRAVFRTMVAPSKRSGQEQN